MLAETVSHFDMTDNLPANLSIHFVGVFRSVPNELWRAAASKEISKNFKVQLKFRPIGLII